MKLKAKKFSILLSTAIALLMAFSSTTAFSQITATFDADGNQSVDGGTDGILINRYLSGYRGDSLIKGVVGADCTPMFSRNH